MGGGRPTLIRLVRVEQEPLRGSGNQYGDKRGQQTAQPPKQDGERQEGAGEEKNKRRPRKEVKEEVPASNLSAQRERGAGMEEADLG